MGSMMLIHLPMLSVCKSESAVTSETGHVGDAFIEEEQSREFQWKKGKEENVL